ncbi:MAG TPA: hypothetical protein VNI78_05915 [Vicinamibacterales bacterium]|nr:hypothetical protein [Vicinamibacterales bacterium]
MLSTLLGGAIAVGISWLVLERLSHLTKDGAAGHVQKPLHSTARLS